MFDDSVYFTVGRLVAGFFFFFNKSYLLIFPFVWSCFHSVSLPFSSSSSSAAVAAAADDDDGDDNDDSESLRRFGCIIVLRSMSLAVAVVVLNVWLVLRHWPSTRVFRDLLLPWSRVRQALRTLDEYAAACCGRTERLTGFASLTVWVFPLSHFGSSSSPPPPSSSSSSSSFSITCHMNKSDSRWICCCPLTLPKSSRGWLIVFSFCHVTDSLSSCITIFQRDITCPTTFFHWSVSEKEAKIGYND